VAHVHVAECDPEGARVTLVSLLLLDLILIALCDVAIVRPLARRLRRRFGAQRLGLLPSAVVPMAEAARVARLRQLGEAGTYRVYNCGKILHVDYDRGELIVEEEGHRR
jgi:hypothetical protein